MSALRAAEHPRANHTLVHLSDTHFVRPGQLLSGVAPVREHLEGLLEDLVATNLRPEALIFTGDLADRGEASAYRQLRELVEPLAGQLGDLAASRIKRALGIKDFGTIFPGHGGIMDRFDSIMAGIVVLLVAFTIIYGV